MSKQPDKLSATSESIGSWTKRTAVEVRGAPVGSTTSWVSKSGRVLVQGQVRSKVDGGLEFRVSVDPAAVAKKIAIRQLNAEIEGAESAFDALRPSKTGS